MLTVEACRGLIGAAGSDLSDDEVARLRDQLYELARCAVHLHEQDRTGRSVEAVLDQLPSEERDSIKERAAVLEFDGNMPRAKATRAALSSRVLRSAGSRRIPGQS
jgi:hypothetical protein